MGMQSLLGACETMEQSFSGLVQPARNRKDTAIYGFVKYCCPWPSVRIWPDWVAPRTLEGIFRKVTD